jgi:hypothetical protein
MHASGRGQNMPLLRSLVNTEGVRSYRHGAQRSFALRLAEREGVYTDKHFQ